MADKYDPLYAVVPPALSNPWSANGDYQPDLPLLHSLIDVTVQNGKAFKPRSGALAAATNVWVATELRRAGVDADRVWPRRTQPRVLVWDAAAAAQSLPALPSLKTLQKQWGVTAGLSAADLAIVRQRTVEALLREIGRGPALPPDPATGHRKHAGNILGAHFPKEIDVVMARFDRGLELGISTKTMIREPTKNIPNRREEASGDLLNIRRRFPLSVFGYFFLLEYEISKNQAHLDKIIDMCRKIALTTPGDEGNAYDATCLVVVELQQNPPATTLRLNKVPSDLQPDRFFSRMIDLLMRRSQADDHGAARQLWTAAGHGP